MSVNTMLLMVGPFPLPALIGAALAGFVVGYLLKMGVIEKHRKRVLKVENEMLANHSRILSLEKKVADLEVENKDLRDRLGNVKPELKVS